MSMGFFNRIKESAKDITGIGLSASEQYKRAYTKGVFLQPPDYQSAAENFHEAEEKFKEEGNVSMAHQAKANSELYRFISRRDPSYIFEVAQALRGIESIERIGSDTEMVPTELLIKELSAMQLELHASSSDSFDEKIGNYRKASEIYFSLGSNRFTFLKLFKTEGPKESPMVRGYYTMALADYWEALGKLRSDPDDARNMMQKSLTEFKQSRNREWIDRVGDVLNRLKVSRHCWICHRDMRGQDIYFKHYPSDVVPYHEKLIDKLKQDPGMLENEGKITVCTACGSMIEKQADRYAEVRAQEVRNWAQEVFDRHSREIEELRADISSLRAGMHTSSFH